MYGVLLAGGTGSRLWPLTEHANKHALPVYDRPMIFHSLGNLVRANIYDIVVVTGGEHYEQIKTLLDTTNAANEKSTRDLIDLPESENLNMRYRLQDRPAGIADALSLAQWIVRDQPITVMLADNIFENDYVLTAPVKQFTSGAHIFLKEIPTEQLFETVETRKDNVKRAKYGMARIEKDRVVEIIEKPTLEKLPSNYAVTGAYLYDQDVFSIVHTLTPSKRGELEITDVNNAYIKLGKMKYSIIDGWWADAGESKDGLFLASEQVRRKMMRKTIEDKFSQ